MENPNRDGYVVRRRVTRVDFPVPEGPEMMIGRGTGVDDGEDARADMAYDFRNGKEVEWDRVMWRGILI